MGKVVSGLPGRYSPTYYPWEKWLDGRTWLLIRGEDFNISLEAFRAQVYRAAKKQKVKVSTRAQPPSKFYLQAAMKGKRLSVIPGGKGKKRAVKST